MNWFKNLKTARKLIALTSFMLVIMLIIGYQGIITSQSLNRRLERIYQINLLGIFYIEEVQSNYLQYRANLLNYIIKTDNEALEANFVELDKVINDQMEQYKKSINTEKDREMALSLEKSLNDYRAFAVKIIGMVKSGDRDTAGEVVETEGAQLVGEIRKNIDALVAFNENDAEAAENAAEKEYQNAFSLLLIIGIIGIVASLGIGIYVAQLIARPIALAVEGIKKMARGDFTTELNIDTKDEIGQMAVELGKMGDSLSELITNILDSSNRVGNGSHEIATGNQDLSQRTQEQASTLEEVASTIEEINASIQQTSAHSEQADSISQTTLGAVREGEKAVDATMDAMKQISASSQQIADIIKVVNDIAFQTNLLALNAAVEAARAGEQGRGFAVVAAEVRNLAGRTAESSKEIEKLIKESVDRVENGNVLVEKAGQMLKQIVENTKHTSDVVVEITAAVKEQAGAAGQIQSAIEQLNQVTQQNAAMVEEIASSSESLNSEAEELSQMVSVFKVKGDVQKKSGQKSGKESNKTRPSTTSKDKVQLGRSFKEDDLEQF
jgi:methyl-accepting chemotaxis protein